MTIVDNDLTSGVAMSTAELLSTDETVAETVFDATGIITRLGPESSGLTMSRDEFLAIEECDERYRYELIQGVVIVVPPSAEGERGPNDQLGYWLRRYHEDHQEGEILDDTLPEQEIETSFGIRRADRVIWAGLGRQPNTMTDVPTIVIEIVSKGRRDQRRDYEQKRAEYAELGVKEYWVFDRFRRTITICCGDEVTRVVKENETYETKLLPGFQLSLEKLLAVADRWSEEKS